MASSLLESPSPPIRRPLRNGKELLIASKAYAREHRGASWFHLISTLLIFSGLIAVTLWVGLPWPIRTLASILAGFVFVRLFVIYHDYQHGSILRGSKFASAVMTTYGYLSLSPPSTWNHAHNHHHKHNAKVVGATLGTFPVITTHEYARAGWWERLGYTVSRHTITIALGYPAIFLFSGCVVAFVCHPRKHADAGLAVLVHAALIAGLWLTLGWSAAVLAVVVPLGIASAVGSYLFYAQHNYPQVKLCENEDWDYVGAALHSSSYCPMGPLMRWVTANIGYHHVHHLNSRIPFYRLPEAMAGIEELQVPGVTTLHPRDILQCLALKLWDPEQDRMVPFPRSGRKTPAASTSSGSAS